VPCRQAQGTVTAADDQQVGPQGQRGREAGLQLARPVDRKRAEQIDPRRLAAAGRRPGTDASRSGTGC
jgi:hypothetical protein